MSVVRRASVGAVVAGVVLLAGPGWAQEDPCAPGPDGQVPEMCQSGPAEQPVSDTGTVGMQPEDPCPAQPVEPGDGVVSDDDQGIAVGEPPPDGSEPGSGEAKPEPAPDAEPPVEEPAGAPDGSTDDAPTLTGPVVDGEDGVICAFAVPVAAPDSAAVPESAPGSGTAAGQLPRTGPYDRLLALTAVGSALLVLGAGAVAVGRRPRSS